MRTIPHISWNVNASEVTVTANGDAENARHDKKAVLSQRCPRDAQSDNTHMVLKLESPFSTDCSAVWAKIRTIKW